MRECKSSIRRRLITVITVLLILFLNLFILVHNFRDRLNLNNSAINRQLIFPHSSSAIKHTEQWIKNPNFDNSSDYWYSSIEGDSSDVKMNVSNGCANFEIQGENNIFSIISDPPSASNWTETVNPDFPNFPDVTEITEYGCRVSHEFNDITAVQIPCVHWDRNVTLPVNLSDYIITSASIQSVVNATVDENLDRFWDYYFSRLARTDPNYDVDTYSIGDYARFYVQISDLSKNRIYEIAYFQTQQIGSGAPPGKDYLSDTLMNSVSEDVLIFYLTSVLGTNNSDFTLTLGIRLYIEDNVASYWDLDTFDELLIKSVNLTFSYEKKIDKLTSISWNQIGASLSETNLEIIAASLNFKYKIDQNWKSSFTINSELRIFINNYDSNIKFNLNSLNTTFQELELGGMDIISLILKNVNISLSFQLYLADTFVLDKLMQISLDDVQLEISYITYYEDPPPPDLLLLLILLIFLILIAIFGALSYRAYILIPRKIKRKNILLRRTQKFKDINNIQAIILTHKSSGLPIYTYSNSNLFREKDSLFSGFIHAISIIGQEIIKGESNDKILKHPKNIIEEQKIIELDLKTFHCLVLDIEELRTVLINISKASKRLKQLMFSFALKVYFEIENQIKHFNNDLSYYQEKIPPYLDEYFELYYKENFKINYLESDVNSIKRKYQLNHLQSLVLKSIYSSISINQSFKLLDIIQKMNKYDENIIIDAIELLIEKKVILPLSR